MRSKKALWIIGGALVVLAVVAGGAGVAVATGVGDDNSQPITGSALEQASAAALAQTGGGRVTETEVNDEEGAYEVEVTLDDGSQVDVHLDANFNVINQQADGDNGEQENGQNDDD